LGASNHDRWVDLWDRHADAVHAYALRRVGPDDAPDVVAEVFTVAMARTDRVPDDALPWLYRTVGWNSRSGQVHWQEVFGPGLEPSGRPLPHRDICAVWSSPGPARSAVVQCSRGDRLRLLDVRGDRWLDLPVQPKPIVTSLWNGRDLYAITTGGRLLALR
jgi:hypothetical protein